MRTSNERPVYGALGVLGLVVAVIAGCGPTVAPTSGPAPTNTTAGVHDDDEHAAAGDHSGWWCPEHGLPEEVCDLCGSRYRKQEKAKGNWCEHDRVKTSCFICNPGLKEKYAAEYKAKYGKAPPPIEDEDESTNDNKK